MQSSDTSARDRIADLVRALHSSDLNKEAVGELYELFHPRVLAFCRRRADDAGEDIAHDVFIRFIAAAKKAAVPPEAAEKYLFGIAKNAVIDYHRSPWRTRIRTDAEGQDVPEAGGAQHGGERLIRSESIAAIREAALSLPPQYRPVYQAYLKTGTGGEQLRGQLKVSDGRRASDLLYRLHPQVLRSHTALVVARMSTCESLRDMLASSPGWNGRVISETGLRNSVLTHITACPTGVCTEAAAQARTRENYLSVTLLLLPYLHHARPDLTAWSAVPEPSPGTLAPAAPSGRPPAPAVGSGAAPAVTTAQGTRASLMHGAGKAAAKALRSKILVGGVLATSAALGTLAALPRSSTAEPVDAMPTVTSQPTANPSPTSTGSTKHTRITNPPAATPPSPAPSAPTTVRRPGTAGGTGTTTAPPSATPVPPPGSPPAPKEPGGPQADTRTAPPRKPGAPAGNGSSGKAEPSTTYSDVPEMTGGVWRMDFVLNGGPNQPYDITLTRQSDTNCAIAGLPAPCYGGHWYVPPSGTPQAGLFDVNVSLTPTSLVLTGREDDYAAKGPQSYSGTAPNDTSVPLTFTGTWHQATDNATFTLHRLS